MTTATTTKPVSVLISKTRVKKAAPVVAKAADEFEDPGAVDGSKVYGRGRYRASQLSVLVSRYIQIRGDLLIEQGRFVADSTGDLTRVARVCSDFLVSAKAELESRRANLPLAANLLGMADRALVSLYRPEILRLRLQTVQSELRLISPTPHAQIDLVRSVATSMDDKTVTDDLAEVQTALKDALTFIHGCDERILIEDDLQVSRLNTVLYYVLGGWILFMVAIPFVSSVQATADGSLIWPVFDFHHGAPIDLVIGALGLSVVGAVGGIISGMLSVRDSRATLLDYRTSMKKLALKPAVGAVAALTLYLFLSAGVVSGVDITNAGIYIVAAFLAGFSERYLLRVLNTQLADQSDTRPGRVTASAVAPAPLDATRAA